MRACMFCLYVCVKLLLITATLSKNRELEIEESACTQFMQHQQIKDNTTK